MQCIAKIIAGMNLKTTKLNACQVTVKMILEMVQADTDTVSYFFCDIYLVILYANL